MNEATLLKILAELRDHLIGAQFGKIFVLGRDRLAIDMRREHGKYLYISVNPVSPGIYLIKRKLKELSQQEGPAGTFASLLRKRLSNARLAEINKFEGDRVLKVRFDAGEGSVEDSYTLIVQLTGRSSNLFLLDSAGIIVDSLRSGFGDGQTRGAPYTLPQRPASQTANVDAAFDSKGFESLSEALDVHYLRKEVAERERSLAASARALLRTEIKKKQRLLKKLAADLKNHGEPDKWKRLGDLLKANIATAKMENGIAVVVDYFDDSLPTIEVEIGERHSIAEAAESYFKKYTKSRNAQLEIAGRLKLVKEELEKLETRASTLEAAITSGDVEAIAKFLPGSKKRTKRKEAVSAVSKYAREYLSSDGLVILVGKRSKDNDYLTFRVAKSLDIWLHAEDYPGSHVIIRRSGKSEVPQNTILEAAMLAAFYSKAKKENKAAVKYTERKFVSKHKGAAPGLVSISSSKTILVVPSIPDTLSS